MPFAMNTRWKSMSLRPEHPKFTHNGRSTNLSLFVNLVGRLYFGKNGLFSFG
jgi:hypothetical protein